MEKRVIKDVKSCYLRGVQVEAKVTKTGRALEGGAMRDKAEQFIMYSAMSHNKWDENDGLKNISPFWAVLLAEREFVSMVNMATYTEDYKVGHPVAKIHGDVVPNSSLWVKLPFLTNKKDLEEGDLLVIPWDAGMENAIINRFPPLHTEEA